MIASLLILSCKFALGQTFDTISVYFNVDSDQPIVNRTTEYANYEQSSPGFARVVRLEAHCDTTGSLDYNDDLAKRRIDAVRKMLVRDRWTVSDNEKIYSERLANKAKNYSHEIFRRVDIIIQIKPPTNAELLRMELNAFKADTAKVKSVDLKILFHGGQTILLQESIPEAKELKDFMLANPEIRADIHGHVCCADNYPLSFNRAKKIAEFLMAQGVDANRLTFQGHSNKQPKISPERTDEDRKQNRRVVVVFKKN